MVDEPLVLGIDLSGDGAICALAPSGHTPFKLTLFPGGRARLLRRCRPRDAVAAPQWRRTLHDPRPGASQSPFSGPDGDCRHQRVWLAGAAGQAFPGRQFTRSVSCFHGASTTQFSHSVSIVEYHARADHCCCERRPPAAFAPDITADVRAAGSDYRRRGGRGNSTRSPARTRSRFCLSTARPVLFRTTPPRTLERTRRGCILLRAEGRRPLD